MYYMNARYYDPSLAVFICPDPSMSGSNHYAYVRCQPITFNDPNGTEEEDTSSNIQWMSFSDWCNYAYDLSCQGIDPNGPGYGIGSENYNNAMYSGMMNSLGVSFTSNWTPEGQIASNLANGGTNPISQGIGGSGNGEIGDVFDNNGYLLGTHTQNELNGIFGDHNGACDLTAIFNNIEMKYGHFLSSEVFQKYAKEALNMKYVKSNGYYPDDTTEINSVRFFLANFIWHVELQQKGYWYFESVDRSEINNYSIIQTRSAQPGFNGYHFVNVASIDEKYIMIFDTYDGGFKIFDNNDRGFTNNINVWWHSYTNMDFYDE